MTTPMVEIFPDKTALVQKALQEVVALVGDAVAHQGFCTLALAGGSTPKPLYQQLSQANLPWDKLYLFWGDERYVPIEHPDSNAGMAKQVWLDRVPVPSCQVFVTPTEVGAPEQSAQSYETTLRSVFGRLQGLAPDEVPQFDLILLGMGDDGHTASLFPFTPALQVRDRLVTVGNKDGEPRITFTVPLINRSRCVMFLAAGANKRAALQQIFAPQADDQAYPARLIRPVGALRWLLDADAVENLSLPRTDA
ncbi:MAG TPA: 6-phosphogluconolactonase [Leptolyngbyaceae cyanobacterium M65_K2018_010]|nr:6-phosphogluconolactonase [Leptolyngbyaceae cyanobacterium M65_K2018_010]